MSVPRLVTATAPAFLVLGAPMERESARCCRPDSSAQSPIGYRSIHRRQKGSLPQWSSSRPHRISLPRSSPESLTRAPLRSAYARSNGHLPDRRQKRSPRHPKQTRLRILRGKARLRSSSFHPRPRFHESANPSCHCRRSKAGRTRNQTPFDCRLKERCRTRQRQGLPHHRTVQPIRRRMDWLLAFVC